MQQSQRMESKNSGYIRSVQCVQNGILALSIKGVMRVIPSLFHPFLHLSLLLSSFHISVFLNRSPSHPSATLPFVYPSSFPILSCFVIHLSHFFFPSWSFFHRSLLLKLSSFQSFPPFQLFFNSSLLSFFLFSTSLLLSCFPFPPFLLRSPFELQLLFLSHSLPPYIRRRCLFYGATIPFLFNASHFNHNLLYDFS